ncbi:MAG: SIR2 family protein [Bacteroidales bacterium]|nr:SIR2 family protein [Bacteroidales bacterium]
MSVNKGEKHIAFLLGAGFSVPAGLPTANDLWKMILKHYKLQLEYEFKSSSVMEKPFTDWWLFPFWKTLKSYPNENEISYEDFFDRLLSEKEEKICTTCLSNFISENINNYWNGGNSQSLKALLFDSWNRELVNNHREIVQSCINTYQNIIRKSLSVVKIDGYDNFASIINNLYLCGNHIDIFTLNHDLLVEQLLQTWSIKFDDGYDYNNAKKIGKHLFYDVKTNMHEKGNVNLYKLHGSIDLYKYKENGNNDYRYAKVINGDPFMVSDDTIFEIHPYFLTGITAKLQEYNNKYISHLMSLFETVLAKSQNLIMIGYSGNDGGINNVIFENYDNWSNTIIISPDANKHPFVKEKQAIAINKGIESLSLNDLNLH